MDNVISYKYADGTKIWSYSGNDTSITGYVLEITPYWTSSLEGNPSAILVEAEHKILDDNEDSELSLTSDTTNQSEKFEYSQVWARYSKDNGESEFGPASDTAKDEEVKIIMYQSPQNGCRLINEPIRKGDVIRIPINRSYDGIIKFTLTPIMSYGQLNHLARTISLDQSKISNGEIILSKWSYNLSKSLASVIRDNVVTENVTEEITTEVINKSENSNVEVKTVTSTIKKREEDPVVSTTYIYNLCLNYGFDSYMFSNQINDGTSRHLYFYDLDTINPQDLEDDIFENIKNILLNYTPVHTEEIPEGILSGGSFTVNFTLNSSECKLQPNKVYLCILNLVTVINETKCYHYDYRYLFTNQIFNEQFGIEEDFNTLTLPIIPTLDIEFTENRVQEQYFIGNSESSLPDIADDIKWISKDSGTINKEFNYSCKINTNPEKINLEYYDDLFSVDYSFVPNNNQKDGLDVKSDFTYNKINNSIITSSNYSSDDNFGIHTYKSDYSFKCDRNTSVETLNIGGKKTNLLNINNSADQYGLFLSEAQGLANTMMFEDDSIFVVGMHNDGGGDEEWYGEVGTVSEGFATQTTPYDDSIATNSPNEIDLTEWYDGVSVIQSSDAGVQSQHYYLKHGSDLIQYPSEKDDVTATLSEYLEQENPHKFLVNSLNTRGIVPIFFITSGYSNENAEKDNRCTGVRLGHFHGVSSPADGWQTTKDEKVEQHNFDDEYPYWFLEWYQLNAKQSSNILGTFLIKHINSKGVATYIPTNNYFTVSVLTSGLDGYGFMQTNYLEDYNNTKGITYPTGYSSSSSIYGYTKQPVNKNSLITGAVINPYGNNPIIKQQYSVGDLLATQLAQFGAIEYYSTPEEVHSSQYTISDSAKSTLNASANNIITFIATYTLTLDQSKVDLINGQLKAGNVYLNNFYKKLPSNNLRLTDINDKLVYTEKKTFYPLAGLIPDFSENLYLAEITPTGNISYIPMSKSNDATDLYYWDNVHNRYEVYNQNKYYTLIKYAKFKKYFWHNTEQEFTEQELTEYYQNNSLNPDNYKTTKEQSLDKFIFIDNFNNQYKQVISMPLKYSRYQGLYTANKQNRKGELVFSLYKSPSNKDTIGKDRKITNLAMPPVLFKNKDNQFQWLVDPTQRF